MCGRYSLSLETRILREILQARLDDGMDSWSPSWNIAPSAKAPLLLSEDAGRILSLGKWGLRLGSRFLVNVRAESLQGKGPVASLASARCAVPADAFYEWKTEGRAKIPYLFRRRDAKPLLFAGVLSKDEPSVGQPAISYAIATCEAPEEFRHLHNRAPLSLSEEGAAVWTLPSGKLDGIFQGRELCDFDFEFFPVDPRVNSILFNGPDCHKRSLAPQQIKLFNDI